MRFALLVLLAALPLSAQTYPTQAFPGTASVPISGGTMTGPLVSPKFNNVVSADAYPSLAAAIAAAGSGGTVHASATYATTTTATITISSPVTITCDPGATITKGGNFDVFTVTGAGFVIDGCIIDGATPTFTGNDFLLTGATNPVIRNSVIRNANNNGIKMNGGTSGALISRSSFSGTRGSAIYASQANTNLRVESNLIDSSAASATNDGKGVAIHGDAAGLTTIGAMIQNNKMITGFDFCVEWGSFSGSPTQNITVQNNTCKMTANGHGGYSAGDVNVSTSMVGNELHANGFTTDVAAFECTTCSKTSMSGNKWWEEGGAVTFGYSIIGSKDLTAVGLEGYGVHTRGIQIEGPSSNITISDAKITQDPASDTTCTNGLDAFIWVQTLASTDAISNIKIIGGKFKGCSNAQSRGFWFLNNNGGTISDPELSNNTFENMAECGRFTGVTNRYNFNTRCLSTPAQYLTTTSTGADVDPFNASIPGTLANGTTDDSAAMASALTVNKDATLAAGANYLVGTSSTWNGTVHSLSGSTITVATGVTLTINAKPAAPIGPLFILQGTGKVVFGPAVAEAPVEWFGAVGDGTTNDAPAFQACFAANPKGHCVMQAKSYAACGLSITTSNTGLRGSSGGYGVPAGAVPSQILCNSATATILSVAGTSAAFANTLAWNDLRDFTLQRTVTPTGTATGLSANYAGGLTVTNVQSNDSMRLFYMHDVPSYGVGAWTHVTGGWGHTGLTGYSGSAIGFYSDTADGQAQNTLVIRDAGVSNGEGTGFTTTGFLHIGTNLNDLDVDFFSTSATTNGISIICSVTCVDSSDILFSNTTIDDFRGTGIYVSGLTSASAATATFSGVRLYATQPGTTAAVDIEGSSNIAIHGMQIGNYYGDGVRVVNSANVSIDHNNMLRIGGTAVACSGTVGSTFANNIISGDSVRAGGTGMSFSTCVGDSILNNQVTGTMTTGFSFDTPASVPPNQSNFAGNMIDPTVTTPVVDTAGVYTSTVSLQSAITSTFTAPGSALRITAPNLGAGNGISFYLGKTIAAHNGLFGVWYNTTVPYASYQTYGSGDPIQFGANQFIFQGGPALFGNTSTAGAAAITAPTGSVAAFGTSNQAYFSTTGALTVPSCTGCGGGGFTQVGTMTTSNAANVTSGALVTTDPSGFPFVNTDQVFRVSFTVGAGGIASPNGVLVVNFGANRGHLANCTYSPGDGPSGQGHFSSYVDTQSRVVIIAAQAGSSPSASADVPAGNYVLNGHCY